MPKRISMKGKGADIFFGDAAPGSDVPDPAPDGHASDPASVLASAPADPFARAAASDERPEPPAEEEPTRPPRGARAPRAGAVPRSTKRPDEQRRMLERERGHDRAEVIEQIRRTVKGPGREVSYIRLTPEEKARLAEIVYGLRSRGKKTTENEINRIAVNCMILDYQANGEESVLVQVIDALLA